MGVLLVGASVVVGWLHVVRAIRGIDDSSTPFPLVNSRTLVWGTDPPIRGSAHPINVFSGLVATYPIHADARLHLTMTHLVIIMPGTVEGLAPTTTLFLGRTRRTTAVGTIRWLSTHPSGLGVKRQKAR